MVFRAERKDRGALVTFCGFDGSGKTTQIEILAERLRAIGHDVLITRQPTSWYRQVPEVRSFLDSGAGGERVRMIALLAAADRLRHIVDTIDPALAGGQTVLCDRYVFDTFALFTARGVDTDFLTRINEGVPRPDVAFYLDVPTPELLRRLRKRDQSLKYEERSPEIIDEIKSRYDLLKEMFTVVNGAATPDIVADQLLSATVRALAERRLAPARDET
ncbi:dTMP kinase [Mesorhizobium sp. M0244]